MICRKCGCEKHDVINVFRNRKRVGNKWVIDGDYDTRLVICQDCGKRTFSLTTFGSEIIYNESNMKRYEKDTDGNLYLFEEE